MTRQREWIFFKPRERASKQQCNDQSRQHTPLRTRKEVDEAVSEIEKTLSSQSQRAMSSHHNLPVPAGHPTNQATTSLVQTTVPMPSHTGTAQQQALAYAAGAIAPSV